MDFTLEKYKALLTQLQYEEYEFQTFNDFISYRKKKSVVLRHDVDLLPENSLRFAKIQNEFGIQGTYYFRAVPESWDEDIILGIESLGHEIGYHYENLTICNGNQEEAIEDFALNLERLRSISKVSTICMHGSPKSKYDSKDLWLSNRYQDFGIIAEPYFDVDFNEVFYLTDTGRMWDGHKFSVRDKVNSSFGLTYHATDDIISGLINCELPDQIMFTFHPQRWHINRFLWAKELLQQNIKNVVKSTFYVKN